MRNVFGSISRDLSKLAFGSASLLAAAYVSFSPRVAKGFYNNMLFKPHPFPEGDYDVLQIAGIKCEDVEFSSPEGFKLHGWYFQNPAAQWTLMYSHGNTGNLTGRPLGLETLLNLGFSVLIYDYRGYGKSEGIPSIPGICADGIAAFDFLTNEAWINPEQLVLYGESLGAAVTCQILKQKDCAGAILQSGFASLKKIGAEHVPLVKIYPSFLYPQPNLDNVAVLRERNLPVLIMHGYNDRTVPYHHAEELYQAASGLKRLVQFKDGEHCDLIIVDAELYKGSIRQFLTDLS